jgi:hypothetical protein
MISQESPSSARQPLRGLLVEDSPDDAKKALSRVIMADDFTRPLGRQTWLSVIT